jgi:cytochrome c oxidase subunit 3
MPQFAATPRSAAPSRLAVHFILAAAGVYVVAGAFAGLLIHFLPGERAASETAFPRAFWVTTALLLAGSAALQRGIGFVRREKQPAFRRSLLAALVLGTLFVGVQSYGLACMVRNQVAEEVQTGVNAFLTIFCTLHAMHFTLALLFLIWVTLNAFHDRYDHEYSWGVAFCAWFWHGLGIAWCVILMAFLIAVR